MEEKQFTLAYKPNQTIQKLFTKTKTKVELIDQSNVVYQIQCKGKDNEECGKLYIGTTKRNLGVRIEEHKTDIRKCKQSTALAQHCFDNEHSPDFDNVKVLDKEKKHNRRYTLESLRIQQQLKRAINTKEDRDNCSANYTLAIS